VRIYLCPYCDAQLAEGARFCALCGREVALPGTEPGPTTEVAVATERQVATEVERGRNDFEPPMLTPRYGVSENPAPPSDVALPIPENIAAVIAYITIIPAAVFLFLEPFRRNRFVRFHAMQHLLLLGAAVIGLVGAGLLWMVLQLISFMRVLVFPFAGLMSLAWFFLWLLLVVKAYYHEYFKLPYLGDLAEELMSR